MSRSDANALSLRATLAALVGALVLAGAILLAGGAGSALAAPSCAPSGADTVCTFSTPGADTFTVPAGVSEASFDLFGAQGGSVDGFFAGRGGRASAELALTPGATLTVVVGGAGGSSPGCSFFKPGGVGGVNGGAPGGSGACEGPGGGGASDVRIGGTGLSDRVLVAGGGGGGANVFTDPGPHGGGGGGLSGEAGGPAGTGGSGGDQTGASGSGQPGTGSPGADGSPDCCFPPVGGGGGGGGYYGGAGGQPNQGGGGGSGFGPPGVVFETGVRSGDGLVTVTYRTPVSYSFGGFRQPVDNPPTVNTGRAGRTYPVKFQVRDQNGALVTSLAAVSSITYQRVTCGEFSGDPTDVLETEATGGTSLRFEGDQFVYNWKTPAAAGCYELFVRLADDSVHSANFLLR
jgi:glycine rich protein